MNRRPYKHELEPIGDLGFDLDPDEVYRTVSTERGVIEDWLLVGRYPVDAAELPPKPANAQTIERCNTCEEEVCVPDTEEWYAKGGPLRRLSHRESGRYGCGGGTGAPYASKGPDGVNTLDTAAWAWKSMTP